MLDVKLLRSDPAAVANNRKRRGFDFDVMTFMAFEETRKAAQIEVDRLRAERNANAKAVGMAKAHKEDATALLARGEELTHELAAVEQKLIDVQTKLDHGLLHLPNLLHESVPEGSDATADVEEIGR